MINLPVVLALCAGCLVAGLLLGVVVTASRRSAPPARRPAAPIDDSEALTSPLTRPQGIDRGALTPGTLAPAVAPLPRRAPGAAAPVRRMEF